MLPFLVILFTFVSQEKLIATKVISDPFVMYEIEGEGNLLVSDFLKNLRK